jgi:hypothetical protein
VTGVVDHVEMENNSNFGLVASGDSSTGTINVTVSDSVAAHNGSGIAAFSSTTATAIMVRNSAVANTSSDGLLAVGAAAPCGSRDRDHGERYRIVYLLRRDAGELQRQQRGRQHDQRGGDEHHRVPLAGGCRLIAQRRD